MFQETITLYATPDLLLQESERRVPTLEEIALAVCHYYGISFEALQGRQRFRIYTDARRVFAMFALRHYTMQSAGDLIHKDHCTMLYHRNIALDLVRMKSESDMLAKINRISLKLYGVARVPQMSDYTENNRMFMATRFGRMLKHQI
jgi:chromosomal replication initiation ATPase DnaA